MFSDILKMSIILFSFNEISITLFNLVLKGQIVEILLSINPSMG